jgi:hypothetical protein
MASCAPIANRRWSPTVEVRRSSRHAKPPLEAAADKIARPQLLAEYAVENSVHVFQLAFKRERVSQLVAAE